MAVIRNDIILYIFQFGKYRKCLMYSLQSGITSFWIEAYFNKEIMDALIFATLPFYDPPVIMLMITVRRNRFQII